jgi:hypothetical protein
MGVLFLLVGLIFVIGSWGAYLTDSKIQDNGNIAEGHIEKKVFLFDEEGESYYILEYWFITKTSSKINAIHHVSKLLCSSVRENQTIEIRYSSSNPRAFNY